MRNREHEQKHRVYRSHMQEHLVGEKRGGKKEKKKQQHKKEEARTYLIITWHLEWPFVNPLDLEGEIGWNRTVLGAEVGN